MKLKYIVKLALILSLGQGANTLAATAGQVETQLLKDIKQARQRLQTIERSQLQQRQSLAKKLHRAEVDVEKLREQYATVQRLADEKTLALDELQQRLKQWQDQDAYQRYALSDYLGHKETANGQQSLEQLLTHLQQHTVQQRDALSPQWQAKKVIDSLGQLQQAQVLHLGPVSWALLSNGSSGLLNTKDGEIANIVLTGNTEQTKRWQQLQQQGKGVLHFDPSLNRAIKLAQQQESIIEHIGKGGLWAMPILAFGLIALLCALAKSWQLYRLPKWLPAVSSRFRNNLERGDSHAAQQLQQQCQGSQAKLLEICLSETKLSQREDALFNYLMLNRQQLEKWLGTIAVIAAVAPLLGLLGTVSGMIETFKLMTIFGSGDASAVSGGISEALVTTELGLIVAIPALLLHAVLQRWVKNHLSQTEALAIELSQIELASSKPSEVQAA